jgi:hypothetical protein
MPLSNNMFADIKRGMSKVMNDLKDDTFEKYYGFPKPVPESVIFDIIDPGDSYAPSTFGYKMTKRDFSDPDNLKGYTLCSPLDLKRGDNVRYAVKKRSSVSYVTGGSVSWVCGMLPSGEEFDPKAYKKSATYREEIKAKYTTFTTEDKPKYVTLSSPHDSSKKWSVQLSGQTVFFWRLPVITLQERQDNAGVLKLVKASGDNPDMTAGLIDFALFVQSATSEELFAMAHAKLAQEKQQHKDKRNNVKNIQL